MAEAVKVAQGQVMGAGNLGSRLDQLDNLIGRLGLGDQQNALAILKMMDQIDDQFDELRAQGAAIKAEESQFEASSAALRKEAHRLVRELGGQAALREERSARRPPSDAWWWFLDDYLVKKRRQAVRRHVKTTLIAALVVAVLAVGYKLFLAPDPKTVAVFDAVNAGQGLGAQGDYAAALAEVQKGLAVAPDDPQLLIMAGVLYTMQGNLAQASTDFATARASLSNDELFYIVQSEDYLSINQAARAADCAQEAIQVNPDSDKGYFLLGGAQEIAGDTTGAYNSYNKAIQLAEAQGDTTTVVQAKIKLGYLMQGAGAFPAGTPATVTP
jgi:tetratricopeptide (TPR) repeat protein